MIREMSTFGARSGLILFPLTGWTLWAMLAISYLSYSTPDACESEAFWTSAWFFIPPVLAVPGSSRGDLWLRVRSSCRSR